MWLFELTYLQAIGCVIVLIMLFYLMKFIVMHTPVFLKYEERKLLEKIQKGLYSVKVNQVDASLVEQQLDKFTYWSEAAEWEHLKRIPIENLPRFLDLLLENFNSDTPELNQSKRELIQMAGEYTFKIVEFKLKADKARSSEMQGARYGIMAFAKSLDGNYIDFMLAVYRVEFKLAPNTYLKNESILWGLYTWSKFADVELDKRLSKDEIEKFQNFFRYKALKEFKKEGIIDKITFTGEDETSANEKEKLQ